MAQVAGRYFRLDDLAAAFALLDSGGTRADLRAMLHELQGRGIGNDAVRRLRLTHRAVRESQGHRLTDFGTRHLRDVLGDPIPLRRLPDGRVIDIGKRPLPPIIPGVEFLVTIAFHPRRDGRTTGRVRVGIFHVSEEHPPIEQQIAEAAEALGYGSPIAPPRASKWNDHGPTVLRVRSPI